MISSILSIIVRDNSIIIVDECPDILTPISETQNYHFSQSKILTTLWMSKNSQKKETMALQPIFIHLFIKGYSSEAMIRYDTANQTH